MSLDVNLALSLAQALEQSADGWLLYAPLRTKENEIHDFVCCYANSAVSTLWEQSTQWVGKALEETPLAGPPDIRPELYREVWQNSETQSFDYEVGTRLIRETCQRNGQYLSVQLHDVSSEHAASLQSQDYAHRLEAELAQRITRLSDVERRSGELLAHLNAAVVVYSTTGEVVSFNLAACTIFGLMPGQLAGKEAMPAGWHFRHEDGSVMPVAAYPVNRVLEQRGSVKDYVIGIVPHYAAEPVWCLANAYPDFGEGGEIEAVVVSFIDISTQRRMAEAAELNRQRAESLLDLNARAYLLDEQELLEEGLLLAQKLTGSHQAHLHFIDENKQLHMAACTPGAHGLGTEEHPLTPEQAGRWADCVRDETPVIHNDYSTGPGWKHSIRRHLGAPILQNNTPVMMIGVANKSTDYDASDVQILQLLAQDLWKALHQQRTLGIWQADRRRLEQVIAASHAGIWEYRIEEDQARIHLAHPPENHSPLSFIDETLEVFIAQVHGEDQQPVLRALNACLSGRNTHYQQEFRLFDPVRQEYRWILASGEVIEHDEHGTPICMGGTLLDITEQQQVEEQLRLAAKVFDSNGEGIMITDIHQRILNVNRAFTQMTGFTPEEALGNTPRLLSSGRHGPDFYGAMWQTIRELGCWQGEIWNRRKDGSLYPEWLSISTVTDSRGVITHYVGIFSDITERKRQQEHIEYLAFHDALTGLPNRQLLSDRFTIAHALAQRQYQQMALLFLDLDRFKLVNDTLGHQAGDQILMQTARRLSEVVRESDTVCRLGGDEFVVLLGGLHSPNEATDVAQSIIAAIDAPFLAAGREIRIAVSLGIAVCPDDSDDFAELLKKADTALYRAKQEGRHTHRFYTELMNTHSMERLLLETRLRQGMENGELEVHYQPQVSLPDGKLCGLEALVRWRHPQEGLIPPAHFVPLAEESSLILDIGAFVLNQACHQGRAWLDAGFPPIPVAVNLSALQISRGDLVDIVAETLHRSGLPAELLELELTESMLLNDAERCRETLTGLRQMGVKVSIDDFGTGYSSLAYLRRLDVEKLKIDKSFVNVLEETDDDAIVRAIIDIAQAMRLETIAEGVESQLQLDRLAALGCSAAQGWLIGHAEPAESCTRWLEMHALGKALVKVKPHRQSA